MNFDFSKGSSERLVQIPDFHLITLNTWELLNPISKKEKGKEKMLKNLFRGCRDSLELRKFADLAGDTGLGSRTHVAATCWSCNCL